MSILPDFVRRDKKLTSPLLDHAKIKSIHILTFYILTYQSHPPLLASIATSSVSNHVHQNNTRNTYACSNDGIQQRDIFKCPQKRTAIITSTSTGAIANDPAYIGRVNG